VMDRDTWLERIAEAIRVLGDGSYQERVWVRGEGPEVDSSTEAISALLDDYDLGGFFLASRPEWLALEEPAFGASGFRGCDQRLPGPRR
jgi:hypothetical protein